MILEYFTYNIFRINNLDENWGGVYKPNPCGAAPTREPSPDKNSKGTATEPPKKSVFDLAGATLGDKKSNP